MKRFARLIATSMGFVWLLWLTACTGRPATPTPTTAAAHLPAMATAEPLKTVPPEAIPADTEAAPPSSTSSPTASPAVTATPPLTAPAATPTEVEATPVPATSTPTMPAPSLATPTRPLPTPTRRTAPPININGIPLDEIVVMPREVAANVREIYSQGQALGRNPQAFSKLGSSQIATSHFLTRFDTGYYNLGDYAYLQPAVDYFDGSFRRYGVSIRVGLHAASVMDPILANKRWCQPNEDMVSCEIRLNNPSILLILLGTNDTGSEAGFTNSMRDIIELSIASGVIPVIVTKADRFDGPENRNNNIMHQLAADYAIPLCDFDLVAGTLPDRGMGDDDVHLTLFPTLDYTIPEAFERGYSTLNLAVLMTLDAIWKTAAEGGGE